MENSALSVHQAVGQTPRIPDDPEAALVARFTQNVAEVVDLTDDVMPASFYVALKTKPFAILTGPAGTGKHDLVQLFGQMVSGGDRLRFQDTLGHAWWAGRTRNCALYGEAQLRLNDDKLLELVHATLGTENARRLMTTLVRPPPGSYTVQAVTEEGETASADLTVTAPSETASADVVTVREPSGELHELERSKSTALIVGVVLAIGVSAALGVWLVRG